MRGTEAWAAGAEGGRGHNLGWVGKMYLVPLIIGMYSGWSINSQENRACQVLVYVLFDRGRLVLVAL